MTVDIIAIGSKKYEFAKCYETHMRGIHSYPFGLVTTMSHSKRAGEGLQKEVEARKQISMARTVEI